MDKYLLEDASGYYLREDGSGDLLLETSELIEKLRAHNAAVVNLVIQRRKNRGR